MADDDDIDWELESTCRFIIHFSSTTNQRSSTSRGQQKAATSRSTPKAAQKLSWTDTVSVLKLVTVA